MYLEITSGTCRTGNIFDKTSSSSFNTTPFGKYELSANCLPQSVFGQWWASNDFSFIRPVHWLVAMHGSRVLEGSLFGLQAGNSTRGHRIHSPGPHEIATASDFESVLSSARVIVDQDERRDIISRQVIELGEAAGGKAVIDAALLEEVSNLVEWPRSHVSGVSQLLAGFIDEAIHWNHF